MYKTSDLKNLLYFDAETVPEVLFEDLTEEKKKLWLSKYHFRYVTKEKEHREQQALLEQGVPDRVSELLVKFPTAKEIYTKYAPLHAEFAKIWCISFGYFDRKGELKIQTLRDDNEKDLLEGFVSVLDKFEDSDLAGWNIGGFDIPVILKRMWINGIIDNYPRQLQLKDAKPWTTTYVDAMNDWKSLGYESASLGLVCEVLKVPTPKDKFNNDEFVGLLLSGEITEADGIEYCEKDVKALINVMFKLATDSNNYAPAKEKKSWKK